VDAGCEVSVAVQVGDAVQVGWCGHVAVRVCVGDRDVALGVRAPDCVSVGDGPGSSGVTGVADGVRLADAVILRVTVGRVVLTTVAVGLAGTGVAVPVRVGDGADVDVAVRVGVGSGDCEGERVAVGAWVGVWVSVMVGTVLGGAVRVDVGVCVLVGVSVGSVVRVSSLRGASGFRKSRISCRSLNAISISPLSHSEATWGAPNSG
jgi:hypothetical protein